MYSPNRIILITGPKHSGKSLCSRALGDITGWMVFDLDEVIKKQSGKSLREIFKEGQENFAKAEAEALAFASSIQRDGVIIDAGGGLIDNIEALELIKSMIQTGSENSERKEIIPVYLDVSPETAWLRILAEGELPPFLDTDNPRETHLALHRRRARAYKAMARFTVAAEGKSPREIAEEIVIFLAL